MHDTVETGAKLRAGTAEAISDVEYSFGIERAGRLRRRRRPCEGGMAHRGLNEAGEALGEPVCEVLAMALHLLPRLEGPLNRHLRKIRVISGSRRGWYSNKG